jgi:hypothetical protein
MLRLDLAEDEALVLRDVLETRREEMVREIRHTSHREFRDLLRRRLERLESVLERLTAAQVPVQK